MARAQVMQHAEANWLLRTVPPPDLEGILEKCDPVALTLKQRLYAMNTPIESVYFPRTGVVSWMTVVGDDLIETSTVGSEGFVGVPVMLGSVSVPGTALVQIPGGGLRMPAASFIIEIEQRPAFRDVCHRYLHGLFTQMAQSVACNRAHRVSERTARWLLMTHDRVASDDFPLTQEFLAKMVGVDAETLEAGLARLTRAGCIRASASSVTVLDRLALEEASCACYAIVRDEFRRLLGASVG